MTKTKSTVKMVILQAAPDMVLCDGFSKTSLGGRVTALATADLSAWKEMPEAEADTLIATNTPEVVADDE